MTFSREKQKKLVTDLWRGELGTLFTVVKPLQYFKVISLQLIKKKKKKPLILPEVFLVLLNSSPRAYVHPVVFQKVREM